jgi:hypothetical protein
MIERLLAGEIFRLRPRRSFFTVVLVITALSLRALVPVGFMPAMVTDQAFQLRLCTTSGVGPQLIGLVAPDTTGNAGTPAPAQQADHDPCPFAAAPAAAPGATTLAISAFVAAMSTLLPVRSGQLLPTTDGRPATARGPPRYS